MCNATTIVNRELFYSFLLQTHLNTTSQLHQLLCVLLGSVPLRNRDTKEFECTLEVCVDQIVLRRLRKRRKPIHTTWNSLFGWQMKQRNPQ